MKVTSRRAHLGIISDTHGLLRPEAIRALGKPDLIVHAGDIGSLSVLESLRGLAPVIAVRGNNDVGNWADALSELENVEVGQIRICIIHDVKKLKLDLAQSQIQVVISGHSHRPSVQNKDGVIFFNPGSAGPRRFHLPVSIGRIRIAGRRVNAQTIQIE